MTDSKKSSKDSKDKAGHILREITLEELAKHGTPEDAWIAIKGSQQQNLSDFGILETSAIPCIFR